MGLPGAGKSTFAKALVASRPTAWLHIDSDEVGGRRSTEEAVAAALRLARYIEVPIHGADRW